MPATAAPYTTATVIGDLLPGGLATNSRPNINAVASIIWAISAEVESAAARAGYVVPVGATVGAFAQVGEIVKRGVLAQAGEIRFPGSGPGTNTAFVDEFKADYQRALEQLRSGAAPLVGAEIDEAETTQITGRSFSTSNGGEPERFEQKITWGQEF